MPDRSVEVVEYTDPGCSWAWGSEPKLRLLRQRHSDRVRWRRVMGGLIGDMDAYFDAPFDPERAAKRYIRYWGGISATTRAPYPVGLRWMYRSTEPACRAVKATECQGEELAERVLRRLREATFVFGEPPDTAERILRALAGVADLDLGRLEGELASEETEKAFREDWAETRRPNDYVMTLDEEHDGGGRAKHTEGHWRYVFPTLVFRGPRGERTVAGWKPYEDYERALADVAPGSSDRPRPQLATEDVFACWPTLTQVELELLCGASQPPSGIVFHDWGEGSFYLTRAEAEAQGLG